VAAPPTKMVLYTSRRGDTLVTIADRFGLSLDQLRRWNHLTGTKVAAGQKLRVAAPSGSIARTTTRRKTKSGGEARSGKPTSGSGKGTTGAGKSTTSSGRSSTGTGKAKSEKSTSAHPRDATGKSRARKK
jgi:membrane-bound lytic murein transglycosylase D